MSSAPSGEACLARLESPALRAQDVLQAKESLELQQTSSKGDSKENAAPSSAVPQELSGVS